MYHLFQQTYKYFYSLLLKVQNNTIDICRKSSLFDSDWYLNQYPDVKAANVDPAQHYVKYGAREGRNPGPNFFTQKYLENNPEVKRYKLNPLVYFELYELSSNKLLKTTPAPKPTLQQIKEVFKQERSSQLKQFLHQKQTLSFSHIEKPKLSIILILWNQAELTLACLQSIQKSSFSDYEVILVDNHSTDKTQDLLSRIENVTILRQQENLGFLRGVNCAAKAARGELLLLLNNDAEVAVEAIQNAVQAIESHPDIGAVGGKIILPHGQLQEAGCIIWDDGSTAGYLRNSAPDCYAAQFTRDVDFCSGVFLLTKTALFHQLGGFAEEFAPAYYEETDYCVRLWQSNYRVVYCPDVLVQHFEFGSAVAAQSPHVQMQKNQLVFQEKHSLFLAHKYSNDTKNLLKARHHYQQKRILIFDDAIPQQTAGAGYPRALALINTLLEEGFFVTLYALQQAKDGAYGDLNKNVEQISGYHKQTIKQFLMERIDYYDVILISRPSTMKMLFDILIDLNIHHKQNIIYDAEAIWSKRDILFSEKIENKIISRRLKDKLISKELALARIAQHIITVNQEEANLFLQYGYKSVSIVGHKVEGNFTLNEFSHRSGLLFLGRLREVESPNADSILWFVSKVLPILHRLNPNIGLTCAGQISNEVQNKILKMASPLNHLIKGVGPVAEEQLEPLFNTHKVFIAPTRYAAGIPMKCHHAASYGLPMVTTNLIARQLSWFHEEHLLSADDEASFAEHIARLYQDESLWNRLRQNTFNKVCEEQSAAAFKNSLLRVIDSV